MNPHQPVAEEVALVRERMKLWSECLKLEQKAGIRKLREKPEFSIA